MDTFPDIPPSYSTSSKTEIMLLGANFGDGYSQEAGDGLNNVRTNWDVVFDNYPIADITTIDDFLLAQGGSAAFYWTPPNESTPKKWKCRTWTKTPTGYTTQSLRATFTQAFDL